MVDGEIGCMPVVERCMRGVYYWRKRGFGWIERRGWEIWRG